jgi:branched-chain amino acid transport system permease protein
MTELIEQVVAGIAAGGIYASLALALVIIYRAMGLINFAQGEFAMFATFICYTLITSLNVPYFLALPLAIGFAFVAGFAIERVVVRPFYKSSQLSIVIVTLALLSIVNSTAGFIWGYVPRAFPSPFPFKPIDVGGTGLLVSIQDVGIIGVTLLLLGLFYLLLNFTKVGLGMRAAATYPDVAELLGVRVGTMRGLGWGLAAAAGAVSGILVAPVVFLEPNMMSTIIVYAFAAAVLGGIDNPLGAVVGGLILGVTLNLVGAYIPSLADLRLEMALGLIIALLVIRPSGLLGQRHVRRV